MSGGKVVEISSARDFKKFVASGQPVAADFNAVWCGPCKKISPVFAELAAAYPGVVFLAVDVDANEDVAAAENVKSLPTFKFYAGGKKVDEFTGAKADALRAAVEALSPDDDSWATRSAETRSSDSAKARRRDDSSAAERSGSKSHKAQFEGVEDY